MRNALAFAAACLAAGVVPLAGHGDVPRARTGDALVPPGAPRLALDEMDTRFAGEVARYGDGDDVVLVRRVEGATRSLHPSAECLRATGWEVRAGATFVDDEGRAWATGSASRRGERLSFRERVTCDDGAAFTDVSDAFWHALGAASSIRCTAVTRSRR